MDRAVCGTERTGALCGQCRENYSAFYHSEDLGCKHNKLCNLGWLFYIVSEIIPVTVFFMVIVIWDIQFTTGSIQGFIFYSQLFDTLILSANGQIDSGNDSLTVLKFFLNVFNLNFFIHDRLSFCLWENASSLNILAFKYVTIVYAFSLVFLIVLASSVCRLATLDNSLRRIRGKKQNFGSSMLHGLSGFLVICYSQCTKISLLILTPATIHSTEMVPRSRRVAFFDGELQFLQGAHLLYAIPALLFVLTIVTIPPILLLVYPLCYKVLSFLRLEESKITKLLCRVVPLERLKPFFDSFQSSFKDECRYFSGLYFVYRQSTLLTFATIQNLSLYYLAVEIQFVLMLAVHAWVQPYKASWHNKLDAFLFAILIMVNAITLFRYSFKSHSTVALKSVQIGLAYLPLLYFAVYVIGNISLKIATFCNCNKSSGRDSDRDLPLALELCDRGDGKSALISSYRSDS